MNKSSEPDGWRWNTPVSRECDVRLSGKASWLFNTCSITSDEFGFGPSEPSRDKGSLVRGVPALRTLRQPPRRVQSKWRRPGGLEEVTDTAQSRVSADGRRLQETRVSMASTEMENMSSSKHWIDVNRNIREEPDVNPPRGRLVPDEDPCRTFQAASLKKTN